MKRPEVVTRSEQWFEYISILLEEVLKELKKEDKTEENITLPVEEVKQVQEELPKEIKRKGRPKKTE